MTQMEEITTNIERQRRNLQKLINDKHDLIDTEIIAASQKLDKQLNLYLMGQNRKNNRSA